MPHELPNVVAAVNALVDVMWHASPEWQRTLVGWMEEEAEGHDFGPPPILAELTARRERLVAGRTSPDPAATEADALSREAERLTQLLDELQRRLAGLGEGADEARGPSESVAAPVGDPAPAVPTPAASPDAGAQVDEEVVRYVLSMPPGEFLEALPMLGGGQREAVAALLVLHAGLVDCPPDDPSATGAILRRRLAGAKPDVAVQYVTTLATLVHLPPPERGVLTAEAYAQLVAQSTAAALVLLEGFAGIRAEDYPDEQSAADGERPSGSPAWVRGYAIACVEHRRT